MKCVVYYWHLLVNHNQFHKTLQNNTKSGISECRLWLFLHKLKMPTAKKMPSVPVKRLWVQKVLQSGDKNHALTFRKSRAICPLFQEKPISLLFPPSIEKHVQVYSESQRGSKTHSILYSNFSRIYLFHKAIDSYFRGRLWKSIKRNLNCPEFKKSLKYECSHYIFCNNAFLFEFCNK